MPRSAYAALAALAAFAPAPSRADPPPIPSVRLEADGRPVVLQHVVGDDDGDEPGQEVCAAPCDVALPPGTYRVAGPGVTPSRDLALAGPDALRLVVKPGSLGRRRAGVTLAYASVPLILVGVVLVITGSSTSDPMTIAGGAVGGVGVLLAVPALILAATSRTAVGVERAPTLSLAPGVTLDPTGLHF